MSNPITVTVSEASVISGTTITVSQANIVAGGSVAVTVSNSPIASGAGKTIVSAGGIANLTQAQQDAIGEGTIVVTTDGFRYIYSGGGSKTSPASYIILADITPDWAALSGKPATFPPSSHAAAHGADGADPVTVAIAQVTGLQTALDGKQAAGSYAATIHGHTVADVTGLQAELDGKQAAGSYAAAVHTHTVADVTGLEAALDGKQAAGSYAAAVHTHGISDVTGLQTALDGKAAATHTHTIGNVTGLQAALDGKQAAGAYAAASHTHAAVDITNFTAAAATAAPVQSVAGQTGAVTLAKADVGLGNVDNTSDLDKPVSSATQQALDAKAPETHVHSWSDITSGAPTTLAGYGIADAVSSSDSRLSDARTPTAHKSTHATGGSDALTPTDIGAAAASHTHIPGDVGLGNVPNVDATSRANHTGTQAISTVSDLQAALDGKAAATHGHTVTDVTGLQAALDAKQPAGSYAAAAHGHTIADVMALQTALDGKAAANHTHIIGNVTGLQAALDGKAASTHGHAIADVTGLQAALDGKQAAGSYAAATHTHAAADITSGTIADARLPIATVAQAVAGTSASALVTPQSMHLSRRGSGRSKFFELFTDFAMSASGINEGTDGFTWGRQVSGAGADANTFANRFVSFSRPGAGILSLITGTAANGRAAIDSWNDNSIFRFDQGTTTFETLIYIPTLATTTDDYVLRLGFVQGNALTNDLVAFEYNRSNSANWHGVTGWNGSYTRVDTGVAVAATKWIMLALEFTSTLLTLRINGTSCGTITTNIRPDGGTRLGTHLLKTAGTTSVTVLLDYVYYRHDFNSDRTFTP